MFYFVFLSICTTFAPAKAKNKADGGVAQLVRASDS